MTNWFANLETKAQMNSLAIGAIEEIMGDLSTPAPSKLVGIARWLRELDLAWNAKKAPVSAGAVEKISQPNCSIDLSRIESLVDFPLVGYGDGCKKCTCFECKDLGNCYIYNPTTVLFCTTQCRGEFERYSCKFFETRSEIHASKKTKRQ